MKKAVLFLLGCLIQITMFAQEQVNAEPVPTGMNANGKIWVVMAVCITILAGLLFFMVRVDRKLSKLEK